MLFYYSYFIYSGVSSYFIDYLLFLFSALVDYELVKEVLFGYPFELYFEAVLFI